MANELYRQTIHLVIGLVAGISAFFLPKAVFLWVAGFFTAVTLFIVWAMYKEFKWLYSLLEREHVAAVARCVAHRVPRRQLHPAGGAVGGDRGVVVVVGLAGEGGAPPSVDSDEHAASAQQIPAVHSTRMEASPSVRAAGKRAYCRIQCAGYIGS